MSNNKLDQTPSSADTQTPSSADTQTLSSADTQTPSSADTQTLSSADTQTPSSADTQTLSSADTADTQVTPNNIHNQTPEMANVLTNINDDLYAQAAQHDGLTQEQIDKHKRTLIEDRQNNIRKKTFGDNLARVLNNGFSRFMIIGAVSALGILGAATYHFVGGDDVVENDLQGSVDLPKANVSGNPTFTKEQAAHARQEQQAQAQNAQQNGETYVPSVIVERDADMQYLVGDAVVPGVRVNVDDNGQPINSNSSFADVGLDPALANNGGSAVSASDGTRGLENNPSNTNTNNQGGFQQNNNQSIPIAPTVSQDRYASNIQMLENAGKTTQDWQNGISENWIKRANQTEEIAQTAFEDQFMSLVSTKVKRDGASVGNSNRYVEYSYSSKVENTNGDNGMGRDAQNYAVSSNSKNSSSVGTNNNGEQKKIYIRAGSSYVTQLISEVNTDEGFEVMGRITSGPYKGAQILGQVKQANKNIQFVFTRLIPKSGPELRIEAVAREIGTNKLGMADDVKSHTLQRYTGMILASGMQGYGEAWSEIGTSTTTALGTVQTKEKPQDREIAGRIVGQMGESVSQDILKQTQRSPTYITYSGKVFNLYFNKNVTEQENN